jgi:hypothetical protein
MNERSEVVARALNYPYVIHPRSYALVDGRATDLDATAVDLANRVPLLAYGSNAAPEVLARKLAGDHDPAPVLRAALADFDVVYSAHVASYGSIPATLRRSPGTTVSAFVALLTESQLHRIAATEPNYELRELQGLACRLDGGAVLGEMSAFLTRHGCLSIASDAVALAAVEAEGRTLRAMSQAEILDHVRHRLRPDLALERFVVLSAADPAMTQEGTRRLKETALPAAI